MFDVVVIGAGPAGSAFALAAALRGLRVCVLERALAAKLQVGETVPGVIHAVLGLVGLEQAFRAEGHRPQYALRSYWGSPEPVERHSIFDRYGPGVHLDRAAFDAWLRERAVTAGARVEEPVEVGAVRRGPRGRWNIEYRGREGSRCVEARVLIDATGRSAWVSRRLGAERLQLHKMVGVVRWFERSSVEPVSVVETAPDGWWYSAPVPGDRLVLAWMTAATEASARAGRAPELWERSLMAAPATRARAEGAIPLEAAVTRPTGPALTRWPLLTDFLPVGDAACSFDPMSGAGLLFALRSGIDAAGAVADGASGRTHAYGEYQAGLLAALRLHARERTHAYAAERRFPESSFWRAAQRDIAAGL